MEAEVEPRMRKTRILSQRLTSEVLNFFSSFHFIHFFSHLVFFFLSYFVGINYYFEEWIEFERQRFVCLFGGAVLKPIRCRFDGFFFRYFIAIT